MITQLVICQFVIISNNKLIVIDLRKQQALDANPKAKQQINLTGSQYDNNNNNNNNRLLFFIIEEVKETILDFP